MNRLKNHPILIVAALAIALSVSAQELPKKIRGYKVLGEITRLTNDGSVSAEKPYVVVGAPAVSDVSLTGITLTIPGELESAGYDGRVEMLMFRDFRVNGIAVEVAEFDTPFTVKRRGKTILPAPAKAFLPTTNILNVAWKEITQSKSDWTVTGRVFVFGKFKKFGFNFKRVVPIDVSLTIKNPLLEYRTKILAAKPAS
jgi:hypothetical protein